MKKQRGITLLALIITIIIMLILAGVTISIVGGSDGIVAKAEKAVSQTDKAAMQEDAELTVTAIKMDYYEDYGVNRTKYANAKAFIIAKLAEEYTTSRGAVMKADAEGTVTYTYKSVATEVTLTEDGSVSFGESSEGTSGIDVGKTYYGDSSIVPTDAKYFTFSINEDGQTATITGIKDEYAVKGYYIGDTSEKTINCAINDNGRRITDVVLPYEYIDENNNRYIVTNLGTGVFSTNKYVSDYAEVHEPKSSFTSCVLPNTLTNIEYGAFSYCINLLNIDLPSGVVSLGDVALAHCTKLDSIVIRQDLINIGSRAFFGCTNLTTVTIDSQTIASGLTSQTAQGNLISNATTIYIKSGLTVGSYVTSNYNVATSDKDGYVKYVKN